MAHLAVEKNFQLVSTCIARFVSRILALKSSCNHKITRKYAVCGLPRFTGKKALNSERAFVSLAHFRTCGCKVWLTCVRWPPCEHAGTESGEHEPLNLDCEPTFTKFCLMYGTPCGLKCCNFRLPVACFISKISALPYIAVKWPQIGSFCPRCYRIELLVFIYIFKYGWLPNTSEVRLGSLQCEWIKCENFQIIGQNALWNLIRL